MAEKTHPFVTFLESLREDRGALASLRRGLGQPPGSVPDMYRYVVPWLPERPRRTIDAAYYLVASLFALHPGPGAAGNMGDHFARARDPNTDPTALERRFTTLLAAHPDDLHVHLRQAVTFLRSREVPVNWHQLLSDVLTWGHPERYVQQQWARSFWGRPAQPSQNKEV